MLKTTLTILLSLLSLSIFAQGITFFEGTWEEAKAEAKKTNKHIFVDAYTTWCGPCKMLKSEVFPQPNVGDVYNANYISVALDMEKGEGVDFAKTYEVRAYPTLLYFNPNGELVHINVGSAAPETFAEWGVDALDPNKQLFTLEKKIEKVENPSKEDLVNYLSIAYRAYTSNEKLLEKWVEMVTEEDLQDEKVLNLIADAATMSSIDSKVVKLFVENSDEIVALHEGARKEDFYGAIIGSYLNKMVEDKVSTDEWEAAKSKVIKVVGEEDAKLPLHSMDVDYYMTVKDWQNALLAVDKSIMLFEANNDPYVSQRLNAYAWNFFESKVEEKYMKKALTWINRSVQMQENFYNLDTQAQILYTLGKYEKAKVAAEKAIEAAGATGDDASGTEDLLKKIESSLN